MQSKVAARTLEDQRGSMCSVYYRSLWFNRFNTFRQDTLGVRYVLSPRSFMLFPHCFDAKNRSSPTTIPKTEELVRFVFVIAQYIKGLGPGGLPCYATLRGGVDRLLAALAFQFEDFHVTDHTNARVKAAIDAEHKAGRVTKDPARTKRWVGSLLMRQMIRGVINKAHDEGTRNWDVVLSRATSMLLLTVLQSRAGDILKSGSSKGYDRPYLCWEEVQVQLSGEALKHCFARIRLRAEKEHK